MKKLFLGLLLVFSVQFLLAQGVPISALGIYIGDPKGNYVPAVVNGVTRKIDGGLFGYKCFDSLATVGGGASGIDTFRFYNRNSGVTFTALYSRSGGGGSAVSTPGVVVSAAAALTIDSTARNWVYTGATTASWNMPFVANHATWTFFIKNRGSAALTINRQGTDNLYAIGAITGLVINPGASYILVNDGTYWLVQ